MMRLARRATLLVALSLLTSAATAHAECAWVLWGWIPSDVSKPDGRGTFSPVSGHAALQKCDETKQLRENHLQLRIQGAKYICLPDTVDPRGPKGK